MKPLACRPYPKDGRCLVCTRPTAQCQCLDSARWYASILERNGHPLLDAVSFAASLFKTHSNVKLQEPIIMKVLMHFDGHDIEGDADTLARINTNLTQLNLLRTALRPLIDDIRARAETDPRWRAVANAFAGIA